MSDDGSRPGTAWTSQSTSAPPLRASGVRLATTAERPSSAAERSSLGAFLDEDTYYSHQAASRPPHGSFSPYSPATPGGKQKLPPLSEDGAATGRLGYAPEWSPVPPSTASTAEGSSPWSPRVLAPLLGAPSSVAGPSDEAGREARLLQAGATSGPGVPRKGGVLRARLKQAQSQQAMEERQRAAAVHGAAKAEFRESAAQGNMDECVEALSRSIAVNSKCDVLHRARADCHAQLGAAERALADAQRAVSLNPVGSRNFFALGRMLQQKHAVEKAATDKGVEERAAAITTRPSGGDYYSWAAAAKGVEERAATAAAAAAAAAAAELRSTPPTRSTLSSPRSPRSPHSLPHSLPHSPHSSPHSPHSLPHSPHSPQGRAPRPQGQGQGRVPPPPPTSSKDLADSGAAYLHAMRLGQPLSARGANEGPERGDAEARYACLLDTVRRDRTYAALHRPSHDKALNSARLSNDKASVRREVYRPRTSIFDPDKTLEIEGRKQRSNPHPGPDLSP